jgi:hypothetical protein
MRCRGTRPLQKIQDVPEAVTECTYSTSPCSSQLRKLNSLNETKLLNHGHTRCKTFPKRVTEMYLGYIASLFILFMHFYIRSYRGAAKAKAAAKMAADGDKKVTSDKKGK